MHYLYKITNTINGKIYIGAHSGALDDGYFGSGKLIKAAIAKYGRSNFSKEILSTHTTAASAFLAEAELVTEDFVALDTNYNLVPGGAGASIAKNRRAFVGPHSDITKSRMSAKAKGWKPTAAQLQKMRDNNWARKNPEAQRTHAKYAASCANRKGVHLDKAAKLKISDSLKEHFRNNVSPLKNVPKSKIECPHCSKLVAVNTAKRWHFENCKNQELRGEAIV